jgi:hypothetical protein
MVVPVDVPLGLWIVGGFVSRTTLLVLVGGEQWRCELLPHHAVLAHKTHPEVQLKRVSE